MSGYRLRDDKPKKKRTRAALKALSTRSFPDFPGTLSGTTQQAIRTGGWASPSTMFAPEKKFIDSTASTALTFASATWSAGSLLNGMAPGSTASQRIGRKIIGKSLYMRYQFFIGSTTTGGNPARILIVYDKQANAAAPAITDILLTDSALSANNLSNRDRFITLCDHITDPVSQNNNFCVADSIYKKINLETMFNAGSAGTIGDITSGSIYVFFAQFGTTGVANSTVAWTARYRYTDV